MRKTLNQCWRVQNDTHDDIIDSNDIVDGLHDHDKVNNI